MHCQAWTALRSERSRVSASEARPGATRRPGRGRLVMHKSHTFLETGSHNTSYVCNAVMKGERRADSEGSDDGEQPGTDMLFGKQLNASNLEDAI